jgi:hypothetical protein
MRQRLLRHATFFLLGSIAIFLTTMVIENVCASQWRYSPHLFRWLINYVRATNVFLLLFFLVSQWLVVDQKTRLRVWTARGFFVGLFASIQFFIYQYGFSSFTLPQSFGRVLETCFLIMCPSLLSAFVSYKVAQMQDEKTRTTYANYACGLIAFMYFVLLIPYRQ